MQARLDYELQVIRRLGFAHYFLIVADLVRFAKEAGIPVGPGRGSAAGSLTAYVLGITEVNPLAWGLVFERFLNPERQSKPDIDVDFCYERRGKCWLTPRAASGKSMWPRSAPTEPLDPRARPRRCGASWDGMTPAWPRRSSI